MKVYQTPTYLSDGSITVTVNLAELGSDTYYLWVTNNRQERSKAYSLSGDSDITAPNAPSGLSVS